MERFDAKCQGWRADVVWFLACAVLSSLYCVTSASGLGATVDEPGYVKLGMYRWRTGRHNLYMQAGTMPLAGEVQTLPLYLVESLRGEPFDVTDHVSRYLPWARANNLVFWWLLLAYGGWLGRQLTGRWGGRLAVAFLACEPNLLAHASLATTDVCFTACLVALVAHYRSGRIDGWGRWWWRVGVPLLFAALTFLAKASAIVFAPLVLLAVEIERLAHTGLLQTDGQSLWRSLGVFLRASCLDAVQVLGVGFLLAVLYCSFGSGSTFRGEWAQEFQPHGFPGFALWQINTMLHSNALGAIVFQMYHQEQGHGGAFLLGQFYPDGVWYYFPIAFGLKLGLPLLLGVAIVGVIRPRTLANAVVLAMVFLLLDSLTCRVQIGIRLFLPVIALLAIGVPAALVQFYQSVAAGWGRSLIQVGAVCALVWTLVGSLSVWPDALCYANEAAGGPNRNYLNLGDSNHDWGQGLPELLAWHESHADAPLSVWYFGTDPELKTAPLTPMALHELSSAEAAEQLKGHYLAVSMTQLYGGAGQCQNGECLRAIQPVARTTTFLIYDFRDPNKNPLNSPTGAESE